MNVLSLFDGMSCGQIALGRVGIKADNYFASEIDKHATKVTMANYPNTIQLGDVTKVSATDLPKINLLIGGSPCQGFSFAGKQLNFEDPRSKLFFEYVRILNEVRQINPEVKFLLENVKMKKEYQDVISSYLGIQPIEINSALVSAQNRVRLYWTNIDGVEQPKDKGVILSHIVEGNVSNVYTLSNQAIERIKRKNYSIPKINPDKTGTLNTKNNSGQLSIDSGTTLILLRERGNNPGGYRAIDGKTGSLTSNSFQHNHHLLHEGICRRLTEKEFERLQTVPDNYTNKVSSTQRYKMLGNGWTVDVIAHIFSYLKKSNFLTDNTGIMPMDSL